MKKNDLMEECRKKFSDLKIQQRVNLEVGYIDRAYMIGYNEACEKATEWFKENYSKYIYANKYKDKVIYGCFDFAKDLKQALHPYSVEQIDNCVKEE